MLNNIAAVLPQLSVWRCQTASNGGPCHVPASSSRCLSGTQTRHATLSRSGWTTPNFPWPFSAAGSNRWYSAAAPQQLGRDSELRSPWPRRSVGNLQHSDCCVRYYLEDIIFILKIQDSIIFCLQDTSQKYLGKEEDTFHKILFVHCVRYPIRIISHYMITWNDNNTEAQGGGRGVLTELSLFYSIV